MKLKKTMVAVIIGAVLISTVLTGCGANGTKEDYVNGILDVAYGMDSINDKALDMTDKEIADATEKSMEAEAVFIEKYFNMENVSEETHKAFVELAGKISKNVDYTVYKAEGDEVLVNIAPLELYSEELEQFVDDFNVKKFVEGDSSCTEEKFVEGVIRILEKKAEEFEHSDVVEVFVTVTKEGGKYKISDEDLAKIDNAMFVWK